MTPGRVGLTKRSEAGGCSAEHHREHVATSVRGKGESAGSGLAGMVALGANTRYVHADAAIAQLVEHVIRNDGVGGSIPSCGTTSPFVLARQPSNFLEKSAFLSEIAFVGVRLCSRPAARIVGVCVGVLIRQHFGPAKGDSMALTDTAIRNAKPGAKLRKISDGRGLQLHISPTGGKFWRWAYRFGGKQNALSFGLYPDLSLQAARQRAEEARKLLVLGIDPGLQRRLDKISRIDTEQATFAVVAAELLAKKRCEGRAEMTLAKNEWIFGLTGEAFGKRPLSDIAAPEVLAVLRRVEAKGRLETAKRMRSMIGEVFRYGIATGRASSDPTQALRGALTAPVVKHRAAITEPMAFGGLLRAVDGFQGQPTTVAALKLLALLAARPGELRLAEWSEFDLEKAVWTVPAKRMKMRREHKVPLPRQAVAILAALHALTGRGRLVFPGYGKTAKDGGVLEPKPISENTLNAALRRMGFGPDDMTAHGFRASFSTMANESGKWNPDAIERALAHADQDGIRAIYARGAYWQERVALAQWWADENDRMRQGGKVLKFQAG